MEALSTWPGVRAAGRERRGGRTPLDLVPHPQGLPLPSLLSDPVILSSQETYSPARSSSG